MRIWGYRASNAWLHRQLDESWQRWSLRMAIVAVLAGITLAALVGPRQTAIRLRYEIAQVAEDVTRLSQDHRRLLLAREALVSPSALAAELADLGLEPLTGNQIQFLTADGRLVQRPQDAGRSQESAR